MQGCVFAKHLLLSIFYCQWQTWKSAKLRISGQKYITPVPFQWWWECVFQSTGVWSPSDWMAMGQRMLTLLGASGMSESQCGSAVWSGSCVELSVGSAISTNAKFPSLAPRPPQPPVHPRVPCPSAYGVAVERSVELACLSFCSQAAACHQLEGFVCVYLCVCVCVSVSLSVCVSVCAYLCT